MKKVKFNATSGFNNIPEDVYPAYCAEFTEEKRKNYKNYKERIAAGSDFEFVSVKVGEVIDVPNWYYDAYKDSTLSIGISFDKYKTKAGDRRPFKMDEALMHGDVKDNNTMQTVKLFDLIEDLDIIQVAEKSQDDSKRARRL